MVENTALRWSPWRSLAFVYLLGSAATRAGAGAENVPAAVAMG